MIAHEQLMNMLTRLHLTAIRDQLDSLLDEAARQELTLRETAFRSTYVTLAGDSPPAGDLLSCCTTRKKAKKRTPLSRPLRGFPPSGNAGRGLRKLALRAQTCEALFPPVITSSRRARGERKCR
jgi:hypothetical protein